MSRLNAIDPDTATGKAAELLNAVKATLGVTPNLTKVMANQPAVLDAFHHDQRSALQRRLRCEDSRSHRPCRSRRQWL